MQHSDKDALSKPSSKIITKPVHLLIITAVSIFLTEAIIMFILSILPPLPIYQVALLDGFLLITIVFPLLYVFVLKPYIAERNRMEEKLYVLSITDQLTGLYNRRGFLTLAEQQLKIARRTRRGVLLLYADLDDLKIINDGFGHKEGDLTLIKAANLIKEVFRESDIIARIGGDEFVVFSIETTDTNTDTIRFRFEKHIDDYNAKRDHILRLSISLGVVYCEHECPYSIDELLLQADDLMFEQKKNKQKS